MSTSIIWDTYLVFFFFFCHVIQFFLDGTYFETCVHLFFLHVQLVVEVVAVAVGAAAVVDDSS